MNISIIIFGTVHDTHEEVSLFKTLDSIFSEKELKNRYWLCEGETGLRKCITIKDDTVHLITDALFLNMMIIDYKNFNKDSEFINDMYNRIIELFITMSRTKKELNIVTKFDHLIGNSYDFIITKLKEYDINYLLRELKDLIYKIIVTLDQKKLIYPEFTRCVYDFYKTGVTCEDEILTIMREKSFIIKILEFIMYIHDQNIRKIIVVTVGSDHCDILKKILDKFNINVRILKL